MEGKIIMSKEDSVLGINALRVFGCIMIMLHHLTASFEVIMPSFLGKCAVSIYFCITGVLSGYKTDNNHQGGYKLGDSINEVWHKAKKFYWIYFIMFVLGMGLYIANCIANPMEIDSGTMIFTKIFTFLFMIQSWIPSASIYYEINPLCWYLSTAMFLYFCTPLFLSAINKLGRKWRLFAACVAFVLLMLLTIIFGESCYAEWIIYICPLTRSLNHWICMVVGVEVREKTKNNSQADKKKVIVFEWISVFLLAIICYVSYFVDISWQLNVLFFPFALALVVVTLFGKGIMNLFGGKKVFIYLAEISSILYFSHQIIYSYVRIINKYFMHCSDSFAAAFALAGTIVWAVVLKNIYEQVRVRKTKLNE